jgi:hypothetical protein
VKISKYVSSPKAIEAARIIMSSVRTCLLEECTVRIFAPLKKFCCKAHKDRYHNTTNPKRLARAKLFNGLQGGKEVEVEEELKEGWNEHKLETGTSRNEDEGLT